MSDNTQGPKDPVADATQAGLVMIAEATAMHSDDPTVEDAARENFLDTVDELVDEPLTPRQEEVVEAIALAGGTLTAGLSGALAGERERPVSDILTGAAASLLAAQGSSSGGAVPAPVDDDAASDDPSGSTDDGTASGRDDR